MLGILNKWFLLCIVKQDNNLCLASHCPLTLLAKKKECQVFLLLKSMTKITFLDENMGR